MPALCAVSIESNELQQRCGQLKTPHRFYTLKRADSLPVDLQATWYLVKKRDRLQDISTGDKLHTSDRRSLTALNSVR